MNSSRSKGTALDAVGVECGRAWNLAPPTRSRWSLESVTTLCSSHSGVSVDRRNCLRNLLLVLAFWTGVFFSQYAIATEPVRLTTDGSLKRDPRFTDDGKTLVYCYDETPALVRMMKLNMADRTVEPMFEDSADKHHLEPTFSNDGKWVSYTACTGNLTARLVIRDLATKKEISITHQGRGGTRSPVFSPDSQRVVYAFAEQGPQQLWSVKFDGTDKKQITTCSGISNWPTFTPDGNQIVFANSREKNYEIYVMNADGSNERRLTNNTLMDIRPAVSPNGKQIAFVSTRTGNYDIFVMNIDGSGLRQVTGSEERDDYPTWHPNGRQLAFVSERDGLFDLYLVDAEVGKKVANR